MRKAMFARCLILPILASTLTGTGCEEKIPPIDRYDLVTRHNVVVTECDTLASLSVGNGEFAFTADITGLQTFPEFYSRGIPLGTQSQWGWHSFPNVNGYTFEESLENYNFHGRPRSYAIQKKAPQRAKEASDYFRVNPHRLQLANVGLELTHADGSPVVPSDIQDIHQELNLWKGEIISRFVVDGAPVAVSTVCHPRKDQISVQIVSPLISSGRLKINCRFPYPTGIHSDVASDWLAVGKHQSVIESASSGGAILKHALDTTTYYTSMEWSGQGTVTEKAPHYFVMAPSSASDTLQLNCMFTARNQGQVLSAYTTTRDSSARYWEQFWTRGGAVDFSGSTDPRAHELERRVVLSQNLMAIQCAGSTPPQETGLTYNSWFGKFHLEMHWWHGVHFALWNRIDLLERSLDWYSKVAWRARKTAERQGYQGLRWQKMTDPDGEDAPSSVGSFLIWQQPHYIYFAELCYRARKDQATLEKYKDLVFETATFMADYARHGYQAEKDQYQLGKGLIPAQECFKNSETFNPPFELNYWYWGLATAQEWRKRLGMPADQGWDSILLKLSPLAQKNGIYLPAESTPMAYEERTHVHDHPAVFGALGYLPESRLVDKTIMNATFDYIWDNWKWEETWGWDFPLTAMTATRLGRPDKAIDALFMNPATNTYLANGHNYQDKRLRLYLPGNGSLLTAVAMMCAGYDGCTEFAPGIPKDGTWKVRWEGLVPMP